LDCSLICSCVFDRAAGFIGGGALRVDLALVDSIEVNGHVVTCCIGCCADLGAKYGL
jgi:hypothetical protein